MGGAMSTALTAVSRNGTMGAETVISIFENLSLKSFKQRCNMFTVQHGYKCRSGGRNDLEMEFTGCEDDVFSRLLNERLDARISLSEQLEPFDQFRHL